MLKNKFSLIIQALNIMFTNMNNLLNFAYILLNQYLFYFYKYLS